jgi:hypothetical protein
VEIFKSDPAPNTSDTMAYGRRSIQFDALQSDKYWAAKINQQNMGSCHGSLASYG